MFDGSIPEALYNNIDLTALRLDNNNFSGQISSGVGDLRAIRDMRINNNTFSGNLPVALFRLNKLGTYFRIRN